MAAGGLKPETPLRPPSGFSFSLGKLRTTIDRKLTWVAPGALIAGAVVAFVLAPPVDAKNPPGRLETWFILAITVLVTVGVGLLLFQIGRRVSRAVRFLGVSTAGYVVIGMGVSIVGVLPLKAAVYRYLFAASVGTLAAVICTLALVGAANLREQREGPTDDKKAELAKVQAQAKMKRDGRTTL